MLGILSLESYPERRIGWSSGSGGEIPNAAVFVLAEYFSAEAPAVSFNLRLRN